MDSLYIKVSRKTQNDYYQVNLETLITIFVYKVCGISNVILKVQFEKESSQPTFLVDFTDIQLQILNNDVPLVAKYCAWPVIISGKSVVAGLAAVCRKIVKSCKNEFKKLLGFREACLMACSESSVWTKFCEVDIISTVKNFLLNFHEYFQDHKFFPPEDLIRFEYHMGQPVRVHNVYKIARQSNGNRNIKSGVPISELNVEHTFGEGVEMTLADVVLFPCFKIFFQILEPDILKKYLPLVIKWYDNMNAQENLPQFTFQMDKLQNKNVINISDVLIPNNITKQSLYVSDPTRYKPQSRIYTKQEDIDEIISHIIDSKLKIISSDKCFYDDVNFSWSEISSEAAPCSGALPEKRVSRKTQQLENLAKAAVKLAEDKSKTIVDFCSGSGHLGIVIAALLPQCRVVLIENKEKSLQRAMERVEKMNLGNVTFLQCNLDYFQANFDIGLALHACGVATDLVIQTCIDRKANFICCPCCYGGIHNCHHVSYPRSRTFKEALIKYQDFLVLSHAADQTHNDNSFKTSQGYLCMNIVDSDRKFYAEECGYTVHLGKLKPPTCTPKNNILIGIKEENVHSLMNKI
ncbi:glutathione S-transferase C-terminal domain-containing protein homolog [Agrilus planipennis]|uniref:Glutathione S-transferase C-terminal domain-containing protein homolog n=1 Tax=Agrilus planipennis TaxID=224129 RepID=A0A7F5RGU0_AGRPL|nr:glutathione S-transferase C-terminal domain-containing protein homolog [Agrilus planipennis]